ncbi:MAG: CPBP family intramembrane metalloprotease [Chloroflexi bacterium]|nr:CPBP family intramembrane metalloprotease [Chloroflexota bacterium]
MTTSRDQSEHANYAPASSIAIAWVVTLLVSSLGDILWFELAGAVPLWLLWAKVSLLGAFILLSWFWKPIKALRPFFVMLLTITSLMRANTWLLDSSAWMAWQNQQSFTVAAITVQLFEMGVALLLIGLLFMLRRRRQRFFLVRGDMNADAEPIKWLGQKSPGPLWSFGLVFTGVVILAQFFMFILPLSPTSDTLRNLIPLIPVILLLAASNGFNEEIILRAAPISTVYEVVGKSNAIWMAAILFGLSHYIGGIPSGVPGVLITAFLGWFFGKCMLDSRGFFWPWLFHTLQDILPFVLMALAAIS